MKLAMLSILCSGKHPGVVAQSKYVEVIIDQDVDGASGSSESYVHVALKQQCFCCDPDGFTDHVEASVLFDTGSVCLYISSIFD